LSIGAEQRRHQQGSTLKAFRVTQRTHGNVDTGTLRGESRQIGCDHNRSDVLGLHLLAPGVDPEPLEHGLQALLRERCVTERIARAVQAHDKAVAD
jgi:hypothetical protein